MKKAGYDALLLTGGKELGYVTGFGAGCALLLSDGKGWFFSGSVNYEQAKIATEANGYTCVNERSPCPTMMGDIVKEHGVKSIAYLDAYMTHSRFLSFEALFGFEPVPLGRPNFLLDIMAVKDEREIADIKAAQLITDKVFTEILPMIQVGVSELDIAIEIDCRMRRYGSIRPAFGTIVLSGPASALPHGEPSGKKFQAGEFIKMDYGSVVGEGASDMTRTVVIDSITDEMKKIYNIVLDAQLASIEKLAEGVTGHEVHMASFDVIDKAGYGDKYIHSVGHSIGVGYGAMKGSMDVFKTGIVETIEPGIYIQGFGGVRIEDMIWLSSEGKVNLTKSPKELLVL